MKLKLNEITSSLTQDDIIKNMVSRHQGFEVKGNQDALNYTIASREHAVNAIESEIMNDLQEGQRFMNDVLEGSYQADAAGMPVLISTPYGYSFSKRNFTSVFADESKLYLRAQLLMWAADKAQCLVAQWSPHSFLVEHINRDDNFISNIAIPYLDSLNERFNKEKDTPLFVVIDDPDVLHKVAMIDEYKSQIDILETMMKDHLDDLKELADGNNLKIGDREFRFIERKGSIDYAKYAKDNGLDLEEYRKPSGGSWRLFDAK